MLSLSHAQPLSAALAPQRRVFWAAAWAVRIVMYGFVAGVVGMLLIASVPYILGYQETPIYGPSMGKAVPLGSVAITQTVDASVLKVGDVIAVQRSGGTPIVHRIVKIDEVNGQRLATLRGDANNFEDPVPLPLLGHGARVIFAVPYVAYLIAFIGTALGREIILGTAVGLWLLAGLLSVHKLGLRPWLSIQLRSLRRTWPLRVISRRA